MKRVVITGMGVVSPIGNTFADFWQGLTDGKCGIDFISRFDTSDYKVKLAAQVKDFNPAAFMEKGELRRTDLFCQYALCAGLQAVKDAGLSSDAGENYGGKDGGKIDPLCGVNPNRVGVYFSSVIGGMHTFYTESVKLHSGGPSKISPYFISSMIENMAAGLIAIRHGARGVSSSVVTACATSTNTIGEAFRAIKHGYADAIIAGGTEAAIHPLAVAGFTNCMALCESNDPLRASIPFDKGRNGFVMGEGAGAVVLEDYESALRRGAKIYAEMVGYGNTCDAFHVTAPSSSGERAASAIVAAMDEAGLKSEKLYINAHGTSTQLNDKTETLAIKTALGKMAYSTPVSSIKSMIGHCLGAAGALEAIACIMSLQSGIIPPTIGYKESDPECDLDYVPNKARKERIDAASSRSFGFGGHNAVIALKKYDGK